MKLNSIIIGTKLKEIQKKPDEVKLAFVNARTGEDFVLSFKGLLFETSGSALNKKVKDVQLNRSLGLRATSQLRQLKRDPSNYKQIFIQMEGSNDDNKIELLGAFRNYRISQSNQPATKRSATLRHSKRGLPKK